MKEQLYMYTVMVCEFYYLGLHEVEVINKAVDDKGCVLWYHTPEEALKKKDELDRGSTDNVYSVEVDYYCDTCE